MLNIGILALQGDVQAHADCVKACGAHPHFVLKPEQLSPLDGLIIPGGESTALLKLMAPFGFLEALRHFADEGKGIFGTCAGLILLAKTVHPHQASIGLLDIGVERNAYGRQIDSHIIEGEFNPDTFPDTPSAEMVFIRAPIIRSVSDNVKILATEDGVQPVLVQQGNHLGCSFHPELSINRLVHHHFLTCLA